MSFTYFFYFKGQAVFLLYLRRLFLPRMTVR